MFEVLEGSTVIAIDASHDSEIPNCLDMCEEIGAAGCPGCLDKRQRRSLKVAGSKQAAAQIKYCAFPIAGRALVRYFRESDTGSFCLPSLLLAKRLIVAAYDLKLRWQWECQDRLTGPVYRLRPMRDARVLSNGGELVAQRPEVLS
ncbi:MAG TPA: hypothetical protein VN345_15190 [Blastocatellia bacterium]|nr:hypothetical protein [Blastocatellia bacterium]